MSNTPLGERMIAAFPAEPLARMQSSKDIGVVNLRGADVGVAISSITTAVGSVITISRSGQETKKHGDYWALRLVIHIKLAENVNFGGGNALLVHFQIRSRL